MIRTTALILMTAVTALICACAPGNIETSVQRDPDTGDMVVMVAEYGGGAAGYSFSSLYVFRNGQQVKAAAFGTVQSFTTTWGERDVLICVDGNLYPDQRTSLVVDGREFRLDPSCYRTYD